MKNNEESAKKEVLGELTLKELHKHINDIDTETIKKQSDLITGLEAIILERDNTILSLLELKKQ